MAATISTVRVPILRTRADAELGHLLHLFWRMGHDRGGPQHFHHLGAVINGDPVGQMMDHRALGPDSFQQGKSFQLDGGHDRSFQNFPLTIPVIRRSGKGTGLLRQGGPWGKWLAGPYSSSGDDRLPQGQGRGPNLRGGRNRAHDCGVPGSPGHHLGNVAAIDAAHGAPGNRQMRRNAWDGLNP